MADRLPPVLRWEYNRTEDPHAEVSDLEDPGTLDASWETKEVEVERDAARQALQDIRDAIEERSQYWLIEQVVVGVEPYIDADVYVSVCL